MRAARLKSLSPFLLVSALDVLALVTMAAETGQSKVVEGVAIYLGILPSEMILGYPKAHPEAEMHGGVPAGEHRYHIMVALFDSASGKRITDAEVTAKVSELGLFGPQKKLEPMLIAGTVTYGNYFTLSARGPYRIQVQIRRPGMPRAIEAAFEYARA
jgi:hypothetical protein